MGVLGILPANFKNGVDLGIKIHGGGRMGDDLVDDAVG